MKTIALQKVNQLCFSGRQQKAEKMSKSEKREINDLETSKNLQQFCQNSWQHEQVANNYSKNYWQTPNSSTNYQVGCHSSWISYNYDPQSYYYSEVYQTQKVQNNFGVFQ